jgi:2-hydroxychromene-2-carboxylate isomerase
MAGSSTDSRPPAFFFDLASPVAYLAAERALQTHPGVEWVPVLARELPSAETFDAYRCAEDRDIALSQIERAAAEQGLQPLRWPDPFPFDSLFAMRVATYAKQIGRTVAFALAAYRQAFAGGRARADTDQ